MTLYSSDVPLAYGAARITTSGSSQDIRYREYTKQERRSGKCPQCQKRVTRSRTFMMTVSPFNKDPDTGQPRTADQVWAAVKAEAAAWVPDFTCHRHWDES